MKHFILRIPFQINNITVLLIVAKAYPLISIRNSQLTLSTSTANFSGAATYGKQLKSATRQDGMSGTLPKNK